MVKYNERRLDSVFAALADPTRRAILAQLEQGERLVTELASPFDMSLPGVSKHLSVLENAGLVARRRVGREVRCRLDARPMGEAAAWLETYRAFWEARLDALARYLDKAKEGSEWTEPDAATRRRRPSSAASAPSRPRPERSSGRGPTRGR